MPSLFSLANSKNSVSSPSPVLKLARQLRFWPHYLLFSIAVKQGLPLLLPQSFDQGRELQEESDWRSLYRLGGAAALIAGPLTIVDIMVFVAWPQPTTIEGAFALFQRNWLIGLLDYDLLGMIIYIVIIPTILSLYLSLRQSGQSWAALAGVLTFIGIANYFASNTGVSMLSLSGKYGAATTDAQRSIYLASGQAALAIFLGQAFTISFILVSGALMTTAFVMRGSTVFSKRAANVGIVANLAGLAEMTPVPLAITMTIGVVNAVGLGIWFILIGLRLRKLGSPGSTGQR